MDDKEFQEYLKRLEEASDGFEEEIEALKKATIVDQDLLDMLITI